MIEWRKKTMSNKIEDPCLYCHRRFVDEQDFARFDSSSKKWIFSNDGKVIIKSLKQIIADNLANQTHIHHQTETKTTPRVV